MAVKALAPVQAKSLLETQRCIKAELWQSAAVCVLS